MSKLKNKENKIKEKKMHYKLGMIARSSDEIAGLMEKYSEYKEVEPYIYKTKDELIKIGKSNVEAFLGYLKESELTLAGLDDYLSDEKNKNKDHNYYLLHFLSLYLHFLG